MRRFIPLALVWFTSAATALGAGVIKPADKRFGSDTAENPSFRRHVLPLMGRIGCNGRACHGSFQGQGGFRLSLFGYDFKSDLDALCQGDHPRVDLEAPDASLILEKPTVAIPHKGGKRIEVGSWQYRVLLRWIEAGAKGVEDDDPQFVSLEVSPKEFVFRKPGQTVQLRAVAHWSDGTAEDVTPLCRFRSNDESIVQVSETGQITAQGKGDTHVVTFYDNGVAATQLILPVSNRVGPRYPEVATPTRIDELVVEKLRRLGVVPSELADDAEFLRRVSLDITGTLPSPDEVRTFLADTTPDKRAHKVDELLERPAYAAWWATLLCDLTGNNAKVLQQPFQSEEAEQWYAWMRARLAENTPYSGLISRIVLATSRTPGQSYDDFVRDNGAFYRPTNQSEHKDFAERETMPHYWARRTVRQPGDMALNFSYAFLGVRLQCAQCHKHPFDQWTQADFKQFSALFSRIRYGVPPDARERAKEIEEKVGLKGKNNNDKRKMLAELVRKGQPIPWQEVYVEPPRPNGKAPARGRKGNDTGARSATGKLLGGDRVIDAEVADPRQAIMEWMLDRDNPYFARAFVNRVWAHYFGVGIVDPPDDMNLANPPANAALLDYLAESFINHGYDIQWLHRAIANSRTYQLTWRPNETNALDTRNFSHASVRRLPAEVAYDAILHATATTDQMAALDNDPSSRAIADPRAPGKGAKGGKGNSQYALRVFGQPQRQTTCDCERSNEPTLAQSLYLMNDQELFVTMDRKDGWLAQLNRQKEKPESHELVHEMYLRTLNRQPSDQELERAEAHIADAKDVMTGCRDLVWALLNTKEFIVNH